MMDGFHQQAAGDVLSPRCAVFLQVQAAGENTGYFTEHREQEALTERPRQTLTVKGL